MSAKILPFPTIQRVKEQVREQFTWIKPTSLVHNHGTEDGPGLGCRERFIGGRLVGDCISKPTDDGPQAA